MNEQDFFDKMFSDMETKMLLNVRTYVFSLFQYREPQKLKYMIFTDEDRPPGGRACSISGNRGWKYETEKQEFIVLPPDKYDYFNNFNQRDPRTLDPNEEYIQKEIECARHMLTAEFKVEDNKILLWIPFEVTDIEYLSFFGKGFNQPGIIYPITDFANYGEGWGAIGFNDQIWSRLVAGEKTVIIGDEYDNFTTIQINFWEYKDA